MTDRPKSPIEVLRDSIAHADYRNMIDWDDPEPINHINIPLDIARRILEALEKQ